MYSRGHRASNAFDETIPPPLESRQGRPDHGGEPRPRARSRRFPGGTGIRARRHRAGEGRARDGGGWVPQRCRPRRLDPWGRERCGPPSPRPEGGGGVRAPRPPREQRLRSRSVPAPAPRPSEAGGRRPRPRCEPARAPGIRPGGTPAPEAVPRPRREHHERRGDRRLSGVGRVRREQGGARPRVEDPRRGAQGRRRRRRERGPRGHADEDAPGRVPRAGHLGPPPPGRHAPLLGVAPLPGPARGERRAVPGAGRGVGGARMKRADLLFERPDALFARVPPEKRGRGRDDVRLLLTLPEGHRHARFEDLPQFLKAGDLLVVNESAAIPASLPAEGRLGEVLLNLCTRFRGSVEMPSAARPITPRIKETLEEVGVRFAPVLLHTGVSSLEIEGETVEREAMYPEPFSVSRETAGAVNRTHAGGGRVI